METLAGHRFGLTADTHDDIADWRATLAALKAAWGEVDGVLHCGDITTAAALEGLASIAPVRATRNDGDPPVALPTLADGPRVLDLGGVPVGLVFNLPDEARSGEGAARFFGAAVKACVYGGTHQAALDEIDGVLFVNPGSPSLAKTRTAAVLSIGGGRPTASIVEIA